MQPDAESRSAATSPRIALRLDLSEDDALELLRMVGARASEAWSGDLYARLGVLLRDRLADDDNDRRFPDA